MRLVWLLITGFACWAGSLGHGGSTYPTPVDSADLGLSPYIYTGLVGAGDWSGSGSVAVHPRLVLGAAHVNFADNNTWLPPGSIQWFWKWNQGEYPADSDGIYLTGYFYFSTYRANAIKYSGADPRSFQLDFVANYSVTQDTAGGLAAGWVEDAKKALTTGGRNKIISGYPAGRYDFGDPDEYRMHTTEFSDNLEVDRDNYLGLDFVETGPGNSGGPVWVWDSGRWAIAGVLVSGLEWASDGWSSLGVCSLNPGAWSLIVSALQQTGQVGDLLKKTVVLGNVPAVIPDQASVGRTFTVSGMVGLVQQVKLSLNIKHSRQGELTVTLRSPSGKTVTLLSAVAKRGSSKANFTLSGKAVAGFSGLAANGVWVVTVKDSYRDNTGSLQSGSLEITTR